jgi:hypothetical protein
MLSSELFPGVSRSDYRCQTFVGKWKQLSMWVGVRAACLKFTIIGILASEEGTERVFRNVGI